MSHVTCYMLHATCYMLHATCYMRQVASCVLSADESIWLAREEGKDDQVVSVQDSGVSY